jgi:hypothetical protein
LVAAGTTIARRAVYERHLRARAALFLSTGLVALVCSVAIVLIGSAT